MGPETDQFERFYDAHAGAVHAYVLRRSDANTADEAVAEVFLIAWRRRSLELEAPRLWLYGVARGVLANMRRQVAREQSLVARLQTQAIVGSTGSPESTASDLLESLSLLSESDREILLLTAWEGLDTAEISQVLGIRPSTVTTRLHRARQRLERVYAASPSNGHTQPATLVKDTAP